MSEIAKALRLRQILEEYPPLDISHSLGILRHLLRQPHGSELRVAQLGAVFKRGQSDEHIRHMRAHAIVGETGLTEADRMTRMVSLLKPLVEARIVEVDGMKMKRGLLARLAGKPAAMEVKDIGPFEQKIRLKANPALLLSALIETKLFKPVHPQRP